ncbi:ras gtpase [Pelomyxa schiedti]|nr:ras gtpase [Pelomyxa schiedti]
MEGVGRLLREGRAPDVDPDPECVQEMAMLLVHKGLQAEINPTILLLHDRTSCDSLCKYFGCGENATPADFIRGVLTTGRKFSLPVRSYDYLLFNESLARVLFTLLAEFSSVRIDPSSDEHCPAICENCDHCAVGSDSGHCHFAVLENVVFRGGTSKDFAVGMGNVCGHFKGAMSILGSGVISRKNAHELAPHLQHLSTLNIENGSLPYSSIEELAPHISVSNTLHKLRLCRCVIDSSGAKLIASALAMSKSLVELTLDENPIGDVGISHIARAMVERASVKGLPPLRVLSVKNCSLGESGGLALSKALSKGGRPKKLHCCRNVMGEYALREIAKYQQVSVLELVAEDPVRIICMGEDGVGKSNFIIRFTHNQFVPDYDPTLEDSSRRQHIVDSVPVVLDILDTDILQRETRMDFPSHIFLFQETQYRYIVPGEVFALCYSIAYHHSFDELVAIHEQICRIKGACAVVLIGCKCDLEAKREVSLDEGLALARKWNCPLIETSAKAETNIREAFDTLSRTALQARFTKLCGTPPPKTGMLSSISQAVSSYSKRKKPQSVKHLLPLNLPCCHNASHSSRENGDLEDWTLMASPP